MPIDPSIPLGFRPPPIAPLEIQSPLDRYAKMISLKNLMTEQQAGELGLQAKQFAFGEAQKAAQEDTDLREKIARNPNLSTADIYSTIGPVRGAALVKSMQAQYEQTLKTNKEKAARLGQLAGSAVDAPSYKSAIMTAVSEGLMPAEHGQQLAALDWNDPATQAQVKQFQLQAIDAHQQLTAQLEDAKAKREAALAAPTLAQKTAEAAKTGVEAEVAKRQNNAINLEFAMAKGPEAFQAELAKLPEAERAPFLGATSAQDVRNRGLTAHEQVLAEQAAATLAQTKKYQEQRLGVERQAQGLRQRQFDITYGALVDPVTGKTMADPVASGIANYQVAPPTMSRGGPGAAIMRKVLAINPDYNAQNWQAQGSVLKTFTSGKVADQLRATNTALSHVGILNDAVDALNNGNLRLLNEIGNRLGLETGKTPAAVFQTIVGKVGPELAQAYGESTGGERKVEKGNFDPALPPQTLKANVGITAKLLAGKIASTKFQWESTMGKRPLPMISPEAQGVLERLGAGEGAGAARTVKMKNPAGDIREVPANEVEHWKSKGAVVVP